MKTFGEIIKEKREEQNLLLREVSALTEIDQSVISKFEKGERKPSREQVIKFADIYNLPQDELIISWQSDKVAYDLLLENHALEILKVAESKVEYLKTKKKWKKIYYHYFQVVVEWILVLKEDLKYRKQQ